jgi:membrane fusion protein (multidrug efflux system)
VAGAFADVELVVERIEDALAVPARAVIPELGGKKVYVVEGGTAQPRKVETGLRTEDSVQVIEGLAPGDRVIVTAIQRLRPGLPVSPDEVDG